VTHYVAAIPVPNMERDSGPQARLKDLHPVLDMGSRLKCTKERPCIYQVDNPIVDAAVENHRSGGHIFLASYETNS
jgi:hypothetical protein